jgi:hypothetical protein
MIAREAGVSLPAPPDPHRRAVEPPRPSSRWLERLGSLFAGLALAFILVSLFFIGR